jgi:diguanylate cyclase (GGDEF)-like protein/PAS domain S-box-containing protein
MIGSAPRARRLAPVALLTIAAVGAVLSSALISGFVEVSRSRARATIHLAQVQTEINTLRTLEQSAALGERVAPHEIAASVANTRERLAKVEANGAGKVAKEQLALIDSQLDAYADAVSEMTVAIDTGDDAEAASIGSKAAQPAYDLLTWLIDSTSAEFEARAQRATHWAFMGIWGTAGVSFIGVALLLAQASRVSRRLERSEADRRADERLAAVVEHAADLLVLVGPTTLRPLYVSPSVKRVLGYDTDELSSVSLAEQVHPDDRERFTDGVAWVAGEDGRHLELSFRFAHRSGSWSHLEADLTNLVGNQSVGGLVLNARDVSEQLRLQGDLDHQARHDALTGLANRVAFAEQLVSQSATISQGGPGVAPSVLVVGLDDFKHVNESFGHRTGDAVLRAIAARMEHLTFDGMRPARLAGDTFALLADSSAAGDVAQHLLDIVSRPIELNGSTLVVKASVGAVAISNGSTAEDLLRDAELALDDAKARGGNRAATMTAERRRALQERLELRASIDRGLCQGEFRVVYQPKLSLADGRVEGFEALVRWEHPERGMVAPVEFIPVAEATGQIVPLGRWVLQTALTQLRSWQLRQGGLGAPLSMAVNVSVRQLLDPGFVGDVAEALRASGVPPSSVTLEVTETMLIEDPETTVATLTALKALGTLIAVDDYGAGHASISYLRQLPVDILKIDRSFVAALDVDPDEAAAYLRAITDLAGVLNLTTVAEGIEHAHHVTQLRSLGCDFGQGYHLARPLTPLAASEYLAARSASGGSEAAPAGFGPLSVAPGPRSEAGTAPAASGGHGG